MSVLILSGATTAGLLSAVNVSAGTTSNNLSALTFSNSTGVSFGLDGSVLTGTVQTNYLTTAMASNRGSDFVQATAAFAGTSASGTIASNGISVSIGPYLTTAALSGDTSKYVQAWELAGNTAGTTSSAPGTKLYFAGGNNVTVSGNGNTITISAGAGGGAVVSNAIQQVSSATGSGTNTSRFAADDHVHAGVYHVGVSNDAGNTSGDTRVSFGRFVFQGGNNITLSQITAANELNTIVVSGANAGAGAAQSFYMWPDEIQNTSSWAVSGSTSYVQPVYIPYDISISYLRLKGTFSCVGSMAAVGTAANASRGMTMSSTINAGFYTQGVGASSRSLVTYATGSASWVQQARLHAGAVGSNWTSGHTISYPFEGGNTDFTTSAGATSASLTMHSSQLTNFTGMRFLDIPFNTSLAQGAYWFLYGSSTSLSTSGTANISTVRILASNVVATQINAAWNKLGVATNSSNHFRQGLGSWSTNTIGTIVGTIALANISTSASNPIILMQMIRQA